MRVKQLIEILRGCDPEALVAFQVSLLAGDPGEVLDAHPARLYFSFDERTEFEQTEEPGLPPVDVVCLWASLDGRFLNTDDEIAERFMAEATVMPECPQRVR